MSAATVTDADSAVAASASAAGAAASATSSGATGSAAAASGGGSGQMVWKHIGLHGHSVGTFLCEDRKIVWKSAVSGRDADDDDPMLGSTRSIPGNQLKAAYWTVFGRSGHLRIQTRPKQQQQGGQDKENSNLKHEYRFDGFPMSDFDLLRQTLSDKYNVEMQSLTFSAAGTQYGLTSVQDKNLVFKHCVLDEMNEEGQEFEPRAGDEMMSLDLQEVSQCVLPGNNRNEIEVQFPESDTVEAGTDQLVSIRFYIPPDPDTDPADKEASTAAEILQSKIMQTASIRKTTGDVIVRFEQTKGTFLTPRGRYSIELYDYFLRMRGQKYDYKIKYDDINRLFLLPKPGSVYMCFVIALDKPLRQGQQRYQYLVLQANKEPDEVTVHLDEATLQKEYGGELQPVMRGSLSNLIAKTFKVICNKKVFIPGKFANANQEACVKCAVRANEGLLYPLEKQFVFIHKPAILIRFTEVESVEFQRYAGGQGSTRNFDLQVNLKAAVTPGQSVKEYTFSGIDRSDYAGLYNFLSGKKIAIKNIQGGLLEETSARPAAPVYNEDVIYGGPADPDDEEEGSEDEDYDEQAAAADEAAAKAAAAGSDSDADSDEDMDDDELGSEIDDELDSDLEEARAVGKKKRKKEKKGDDDDDEEDEDDDDGDSSPKKKKAKKEKKVAASASGSSNKKKKKDPKAPKKAMSAYMLFSAAQRAKIQEENPDANFGEVTKMVAAKFKKLSPEKRAKWDRRAEQDKERFETEMANYSAPEDEDDDDDDGDNEKKDGKKKKAKDPNAPKKAASAYFCFTNDQRDKVKAENPGISFGELGKLMGQKWKNMSADEKKKYEDMAAKDKERYQRQMKDYVPPDDLTETKGKGKKTKEKKDPNAPKKPKTSFFCFSADMRATIKEQNPGLTFGELGKKMGEMFKELSAEDKEKYELQSKKDKERYKREMAAYEAKNGGSAGGSGKKSAAPEGAKKKSKRQEEEDEDDDDDDESDDDDSGDSDDDDDDDE